MCIITIAEFRHIFSRAKDISSSPVNKEISEKQAIRILANSDSSKTLVMIKQASDKHLNMLINKDEVKERLEKGFLQVSLIFEAIGTSKDVKEVLKWSKENLAGKKVYCDAIKDDVYQFRVLTVSKGGESAWSEWFDKTAGDNTFGDTTWNNSIIETDHSLIVSVELQTVPSDFDYIELYVRDTVVSDSSANTTYTDTRVTDGEEWDLSKVEIGDVVHAGTSYGVIANVNNSENYVDVSFSRSVFVVNYNVSFKAN